MKKEPLALTGLLLAALFCLTQSSTLAGQTSLDAFIYILPDGSIEPSFAPIAQTDNVYKLTANLSATTIVIERDNLVLDGQGFISQGTGQDNGQAAINLTCTGSTVRNFLICGWQVGVLGIYDNNTIAGNSFNGNYYDIAVYGNNYGISQNQHLSYVRIKGSDVWVYGNDFQTRRYGSAFWISNSTNITIEANEFRFDGETTSFVSIDSESDIRVFHNNFFDTLLPSKGQSYLFGMAGVGDVEPWDNGFPSGGNYWHDFASKYGNASVIDDTGIWDTTYVISERLNLVDRYPLYKPYDTSLSTPHPSQAPDGSPGPSVPEITIASLLMVIIASFIVVVLKRQAIGRPRGTVSA
ncbi:MAG: hypothetical protein ACM3UY_07565 [Methanocella sp.]|jgi:hypothetical protein